MVFKEQLIKVRACVGNQTIYHHNKRCGDNSSLCYLNIFKYIASHTWILVLDWMPLIGRTTYLHCMKYHSITIVLLPISWHPWILLLKYVWVFTTLQVWMNLSKILLICVVLWESEQDCANLRLYKSVKGCVSLCKFVLICASSCKSALFCGNLYKFVWIWASLCESAQVCEKMV